MGKTRINTSLRIWQTILVRLLAGISILSLLLTKSVESGQPCPTVCPDGSRPYFCVCPVFEESNTNPPIKESKHLLSKQHSFKEIRPYSLDTKKQTTIRTHLRSEPTYLSKKDVQILIQEKNFYDYLWNPKGYFENEWYTDHDGTVMDQATGIVWQKNGSAVSLPFNEAQKYIQYLNQNHFLSYSDWRLPTIEEGATLLTPKKIMDFNTLFDKIQTSIWTSDRDEESGYHWRIVFNGHIYLDSPTVLSFIRACRTVKPEN